MSPVVNSILIHNGKILEFQNKIISYNIPLEWSIINNISISNIRNPQGDNITDTSNESIDPIKVTSKTSTVLTLDSLPRELFDESKSWYIIRLVSTSGDPSYSGGYSTRHKVESFDWDNNKITISDTTNYNVNNAISFYSPFVNYEYLRTDQQLLTRELFNAWRSDSVSAGPAWYDDSTEKYYILVNGITSSKNQIGFAYSDDMLNWTYGNDDTPIIATNAKAWMNKHAFATGNIHKLDNGNLAFFITGGTTDATTKWSITYCEMSSDLTNITIADAKLIDSELLMAPSVCYYNDKWHLIAHKRNNSALSNSTVVHYTSDSSLDSGYSLEGEFGNDWNDNDSIIFEGHLDAFMLFTENDKLYSLTAGQTRYTNSGWKGKRVFGLLEYDENTNTWSAANDYANEIINLSYSNHMGEGMEWQQDHVGGYPSVIKKDSRCYLFASTKGESAPYGIVGVELV